ncbi:MAG: DinB family protein [Nocardioides sp.]|nr:DinB family protein [Nocardioides sp.]
MHPYDSIEPDTKDWTWVLERPCEECGLDSSTLGVTDLPVLLAETTRRWSEVLARPDVAQRPDEHTWSPLEYAAHVRDVHTIFGERLAAMLAEDVPTFANWDQDAAAEIGRYAEQDPASVDIALIEAAGTAAGLYATVTPATAGRRGVRSNGSEFTVETLGRYHLHDVLHHLWDVDG